ncbi:hypothetical protein [Roseibium sp.]
MLENLFTVEAGLEARCGASGERRNEDGGEIFHTLDRPESLAP